MRRLATVLWDAENIQLHSHYSSCRKAFENLECLGFGSKRTKKDQLISFAQDVWTNANKVSVYCEKNERRANKSTNSAMNHIILNTTNPQAADDKIVKMASKVGSKNDILVIVTNDVNLIQRCLDVTICKKVINMRTVHAMYENTVNIKDGINFIQVEFKREIKKKKKIVRPKKSKRLFRL